MLVLGPTSQDAGETAALKTASITRLSVTRPGDLDKETATILSSLSQSNEGSSIVNISVGGKLVDQSGATVLDVYPFVVRALLDSSGTGCAVVSEVRDRLVAAVHPASCGMYTRKMCSAGAMIECTDVVAAAKDILSDVSSEIVTAKAPLGLWWDLHVSSKIIAGSKREEESTGEAWTSKEAADGAIHVPPTPTTDTNDEGDEQRWVAPADWLQFEGFGPSNPPPPPPPRTASSDAIDAAVLQWVPPPGFN